MELINENIKKTNYPTASTLADRLRIEIPNILNIWEMWVRKEVEAARELHPTDLKNSLPKVLENLAQALEFQEKGVLPEIKVAREHGKERSTFPQYTLEQIIAEYRLLRRAIFEVIGKDVTDQERDTIIDAIEIGISESASEYTKQQFLFREQFVSMLAHDLRNPLSAAKISAQLIQRAPEITGTTLSIAGRIVNTIERTDNLIKDLLDSNLVQMGQKIPLNIKECNLKQLLKTTIDDATSVYGDHFVLEIDSNVTIGFWDPVILQRAIGNLLTNAIKYGAPKSPVKITIAQKDPKVIIAVHNDGKSISEKDQAGLFDNFYRTIGAKDGLNIGWGIGLFLVKGAALAHGGAVSVKSQENIGTTFTLTIPIDCRNNQEDSVGVQKIKEGVMSTVLSENK